MALLVLSRFHLRGMTLGGALCLNACMGLSLVPRVSAAVPEPSREYQVKGVLLFHFLQFVTWPAGAAPGTNQPYVIGVLGRDPFGSALDAVVRDERIGQQPIAVARYSSSEEINDCHVLFIDSAASSDWEVIEARLAGRPVLTVADFEGFASRGGMIQFFENSEHKVRLRVNLNAARRAGLQISARLLRVADVITRPGS
jgi:hypothetical protein